MVVKQTVTIGISFLLFLIIFVSPAHAESGKMYEVGTETLEMKNAPDQNADTIGQLFRGDRVTIFQEKFGWVQTYYDGQKAWIASQYLIPINVEKQNKQDTNEKIKVASKTDNSAKSSNEWNVVESPTMKSASIEISKSAKPLKKQDKKQKNHSRNRSLSGYHIVIDPGHGGKDAGAIEDGVLEKKLTLSTAKLVVEKLQNEGANVTLTRSDDSYISLDKRVQISKSKKKNIFISLHYNANNDSTVEGINTFYYSGEEGLNLAESIQDSLISNVNLNNRGAKQANYYVLRKNSNLAVLVELGFITNPKELKKVQTTEYQKKAAEGIADGLRDYFHN